MNNPQLRRSRPLLLALAPLIAAVLAPASVLAAQSELSIHFAAGAVRVEGVQESPVIVFLAERVQRERDQVVIQTVIRLEDVDRDGAVTLDLSGDTSSFAFCAAVDQQDGRFASAGSRFRPAPLVSREETLGRDARGNVVHAEYPLAAAMVLIVRPGRGEFWHGTLGEGGGSDGDKRLNHRLRISFADLRGPDDAKGPDHLTPNDVLVILDLISLRASVARAGAR